jgi:hypothetical protein
MKTVCRESRFAGKGRFPSRATFDWPDLLLTSKVGRYYYSSFLSTITTFKPTSTRPFEPKGLEEFQNLFTSTTTITGEAISKIRDHLQLSLIISKQGYLQDSWLSPGCEVIFNPGPLQLRHIIAFCLISHHISRLSNRLSFLGFIGASGAADQSTARGWLLDSRRGKAVLIYSHLMQV